VRNVTITLAEEVAQWARVWAARHNSSVSRLVGEMLQKMMLEENGYEAAMQEYLSREPAVINRQGRPYPARQDLHERDLLR